MESFLKWAVPVARLILTMTNFVFFSSVSENYCLTLPFITQLGARGRDGLFYIVNLSIGVTLREFKHNCKSAALLFPFGENKKEVRK